ncbi:MAG: T9SS type A sorting domain-containing protein [Saprospiraceae bacterium]|nr:T9SS type A sorting domain-containing protein [Saprospiraceae bacterium]
MNEYFYNLLTTLGNGKYFHARYLYEVKKDIEEILEANLMLISDYDFDIEATDGFAYSNYINLSQGNQIDINQPIIATGKYVGDSPFNIEFRGFYNGNIFNENIVIDSGDEINVTFQAEQVWHANYILENEFSTNTFVTDDVIEVSKEQNLLSAKTIFLCLEPDTSSISSNNLNGIDEEDLVIATEDVALNNAIEVFPNPFVDNITVKIPSTENSGSKEFQLKLINTKGQLVASYNLNPTLVGDYYRLVWDIDFALQSGMYIVEILSENFIAHKNIIHLK